MQNNITIRFFQVSKEKQNHLGVKELLKKISSLSLSDREAQLGEALRVRLERLDVEKSGYMSGEITRIQSANLTSEVHADGTRPLSTDAPLGHGVAFRYNPSNSKLAFQYDTRILGPGRFIEYLTTVGGKSSLKLKAIQKGEDAWKRFSSGAPRRFEIAVSSPDHLGSLENDEEAAVQGIKRMSEAYGAARIDVIISVGRQRKATLDESIIGAARTFYRGLKKGSINVDRMKAKVEDEKDVINFIDDILSVKKRMELPENNPDLNYKARASEIREAMRAFDL